MSVPTSYRLIECRCPTCGYKLDAAHIAHGQDQRPLPGDTSVCLNCGQLLTYETDLTLRKIAIAELRELMDNAEAWGTIEKARRFIHQRGKFA